MKLKSGLFIGKVMHMRLRPKRHSLNYRVFSLLLDIDELPQLDVSMRLFGYNRRALVSFYDRDHGHSINGGLRSWVEDRLAAAGLLAPQMSIYILCYPRILGYVFNPLTLYFCYDHDNRLNAILYEVCNTFGERHTYIIPVVGADCGPVTKPIQQSCAKDFYVSPFMPMNCFYNFHIEPPQEKILIRIDEEDTEGLLLVASFAGERSALNDRTLGSALLRHPLMTLKVSVGIYWEAFRLWKKGVTIHPHKAAEKAIASTVVDSPQSLTQPSE